MTFHFTIPKLTPSNNELLRLNRWRRGDLNTEWFWEVKAATEGLEIPRPARGEHRKVTVVSARVQFADEDNFGGGLKPLLDAMILANLIFDDGPKFLTLRAAQLRVRKKADQRTDLWLDARR